MLSCAFNHAWEHQAGEWKQEKRKILYAMGGHCGALVETGKPLSIMHEKSVARPPNLGPIETLYACKIIDYNTKVNQGVQKPNLVDVFSNLSNEFKDAVSIFSILL